MKAKGSGLRVQRPRPPVPPPAERVPAALYLELKNWLLDNDTDAHAIIDWSQRQIGPPSTPAKLAGEITWIILCAGRSAQSARTIERKVIAAIGFGQPVVQVFGYRAKAEAIERVWRDRDALYRELKPILKRGDVEEILAWCESLDYVGKIVKFQLCKNMGIQVCKPDIWLCRLAGIPDKPGRSADEKFQACMALCREISDTTGDSIAVVDSVLWLGCNKGVMLVSPEAGPVTFRPKTLTAAAIMS